MQTIRRNSISSVGNEGVTHIRLSLPQKMIAMLHKIRKKTRPIFNSVAETPRQQGIKLFPFCKENKPIKLSPP